MDERQVHIEHKVMRRIVEENIVPRSRYVFVAKKLGLGGALGLSVVLAIFFFSLAGFLLQEVGFLELFFLDEIGLRALLESFPYLLVLVGVGAFVAASWLLTRYDFSYRRRFVWLLVGLVALIVAGGIALNMTGAHRQLRMLAQAGRHPVLTAVYPERARRWAHMVTGQIEAVTVTAELTRVRLAGDHAITVDVTADTRQRGRGVLTPGTYLRAVGGWHDRQFVAKAVWVHANRQYRHPG